MTAPTRQEPKSEADDPWRLGSRFIRREDSYGNVWREEVPLRPEDLLYPEEGDHPVVTNAHVRDMLYLKFVWEQKTGLLVLADHRVDFEVEGLKPLGPDVIVLDGVSEWDNRRGTFPVVKKGARPLVVAEITSPDTRENDLSIKKDLYSRAGVRFYLIVDEEPGDGVRQLQFIGYRLTPTGYSRVDLATDGRIFVEPIDLWVGQEGGRVICYDSRGERIPPPEEFPSAVQAATQRLTEVVAARAEAEARAEQERAVREAAETQLRELQAELRRLRGEPDSQ